MHYDHPGWVGFDLPFKGEKLTIEDTNDPNWGYAITRTNKKGDLVDQTHCASQHVAETIGEMLKRNRGEK